MELFYWLAALLIAIGAWTFLAFTVAFYFTRRGRFLPVMLSAPVLILLSIFILQTSPLAVHIIPVIAGPLLSPLGLVLELIYGTTDRFPEYGHPRDILLFRRPIPMTEMPQARETGYFVPPNVYRPTKQAKQRAVIALLALYGSVLGLLWLSLME